MLGQNNRAFCFIYCFTNQANEFLTMKKKVNDVAISPSKRPFESEITHRNCLIYSYHWYEFNFVLLGTMNLKKNHYGGKTKLKITSKGTLTPNSISDDVLIHQWCIKESNLTLIKKIVFMFLFVVFFRNYYNCVIFWTIWRVYGGMMWA